MSPLIAGEGTDEDAWAADGRLRALPPVEWGEVAAGRVVAVAPHPDDEVLGVGGTLRARRAAGVGVAVVAVTDGEASHPGAGVAPAALAARRRAESARALARLGLADVAVVRLGLPDGAVADHEAALADDLAAALDGAAWALAPWRHDGHPDHEATGRAAAAAARRTGARLAEYPVWAWHWASPGDPRVPWERARRSAYDEATRRDKVAALAEFASQVEPLGPGPAGAPVLPPAVLRRFARPFEVLLVAP